MSIRIQLIEPPEYRQYEQIPNWFKVECILEVQAPANGLGGLHLHEHKVDNPYIKEYSQAGQNVPSQWAKELDLSSWALFIAYEDRQPVGGMAIATEPQNVFPFDSFNPNQMAVIWDLRVRPENRRRGIGGALLDHAADWARHKGFGWLGLETSNINVPACKLYARKGWHLGAIHTYGYAQAPEVAQEVMLLWYIQLRNEVS